jgi:hypothetical protein
VAAIFAVLFFVIGSLTPTPVLADEEDEDEEDEDDEDETPRLAATAAPSTSRMTASAERVTFPTWLIDAVMHIIRSDTADGRREQ